MIVQINVKGTLIVAKAFLPHGNPKASLVSVSSGIVHLPAAEIEGISSYSVSKLAGVKLAEFIAADFPNIQVVTIHPGVVATAMNEKSGLTDLPLDDGKITLEMDKIMTDRI
jgi:NAD(P)-dependent dehydrogenase (short-subunit alcohol dehydrogenase family)